MAGLSLSIGSDLIFAKGQMYISQSVFHLRPTNNSRMSNVSVSRPPAHKHLISSAAAPDQQYVLSSLLFSCLHSPVRPPHRPAPNEQDPRRRSSSALSPSVSSVFDFHRHAASDLLHPPPRHSPRQQRRTFVASLRATHAPLAFTPLFRFTGGFKCHLLLAGANPRPKLL